MRKHLATFVEDFQRHGNQTAIVTYPGNRRISTSYTQLATLSGRFSRFLFEQKINPGERVLLWGANSAEWTAAFFGCVLRGIIVVPLDATGSATFAESVIADTSPRLIFGDPSLLQKLSGITSKFTLENAALPRDPLLTPEPSLNPETALQILYTSGTTSAPKGIVHTHGNVLASVEVLEREMQKYLRYERWVHPLRILHTLPLSHVFGQFMGLWVPPLLAAEVHYEDKLVASHLIRRIHRERISVAAVVPRVLELMRAYLLGENPQLQPKLLQIQQQRIWWRWWHLRALHRRFGFKFWAFVSGGATLPAELEKFWNTLGFVLIQGYGMTETTALATLNNPFRTVSGSIGKPLAGREVRIAEDGEILVRGASLAVGTWRNGQLQHREEDWLHTGDLGSVEPSGEIHFLGRKSDVIVAASGMNIHPADLEAAISAQPGVQESMAVGWEGSRGQEPVAAIILNENIEPNPQTLNRIREGANRNLQEFQQIGSVLRWPKNEFPRNHMGKLLRHEVAAWVNQQLGSKVALPDTLTPNQDPLLRLLQQVTGESSSGLGDSSSLNVDSLGRMQLAMAIEEQFGTAVSDESIANVKTIADLRALLHQRPKAEAAEEKTQGGPSLTAASQTPRSSNQGEPRETQVRPSALPYTHWPWSKPIQATRVVFLETVLRPFVATLANPKVQRTGPLPQQPSIYISNHVTAIDVAIILFALPPRVRQHMAVAMSAELLTAWRTGRAAVGVLPGPLRWLAPLQAQAVIALLNVFPLPAGAGLRQSFAHAGEALDQGYNVLVFPEGKRTKTGELQPFQTGISLLAEESQTEIVPMALVNLWQPANQPRFRPANLTIEIGTPLRKDPNESHPQFTASLQAAVKHLIEEGEISTGRPRGTQTL